MRAPPPTPPAPLALRRATPADAARLAGFAAACFRDTYGPAADPRAGGGSRSADVEAYVAAHMGEPHLAADLAGAGGATWLAEDPATAALAGYAQVRVPSPAPADIRVRADVPVGVPVAELARLYVARPWQGRGVAAALLDAARRSAADAGAGALWLAVYQRNARAVAFYERHGFAVAGAATFRMGGEVQDDWVMARAV